MIQSIRLEHFKCFENASIELRNLTVLTGSNASGKSTVIQAILALSQTVREGDFLQRVLLNGRSVHLGTVCDVVDQLSGRDSCGITLEYEGSCYRWWLKGLRSDYSFAIDSIAIDGDNYVTPSNLRSLLPEGVNNRLPDLLRRLNYVSAERSGPREFYPVHEVPSNMWVGAGGEYAAGIVHEFGDFTISRDLVISDIPPTLRNQVEAYMDKLFPGFGLEIDRVAGSNSVLLKLRTARTMEWSRPINVGFGITQVFPIIVAALTAHPGDIVIVENPEVHLHPHGQSMIGEFLAEVASTGVQLLVETHSDHVLNGIRKAVKAKRIESAKSCIYYFASRESGFPQSQSIEVGVNGSISYWPKGFFDQYDQDLSDLILGG